VVRGWQPSLGTLAHVGKPKEKLEGKIGKPNDLEFQEMAAILSPLGLYGGKPKDYNTPKA
jgi:hypothetical protein